MKKTVLCLLIALSFSVNTQAQEEKFNNLLFGIKIKDLINITAQDDISAYKDTNFLIDGVITEVRIIDAKKSIAEIDIVSGEWIGLDEVKMYQATLLISDKELFSRIPKSRRDPITDDSILAGKKIIGIVSILQQQEEKMLLLKAIRNIN